MRRALPRSGTALARPRHAVPASVILAALLLFLGSISCAVVIPGFRGADELHHLNSVVRVAEGGGWPRPGRAPVEHELFAAARLAGLFGPDTSTTVVPGGSGTVPPESLLFVDVVPPGAEDRPSFRELAQSERPGGGTDLMTQHPPGYYGLAAAVYDVLGAGDWPYDRAMFLLRALTALLVAGTVPVCCYVAARELTGRTSVGRVAAYVPLLIPQLYYVGGTITNDAAAIAATAVMWAALFRVTCSGPTRKRLLFLAVVMAAACWTKGTAVALLPAVVLGVVVAYRRHVGGTVLAWGRPALLTAVGTGATAFALGGWWWGLNLIRYGRIQPAATEIAPGGPIELLSVPEFALVFLARMRWTFFAETGTREHESLRALTLVLALVFAVLVAVGLFRRRRTGDRLVILLGAGSMIGVLFGTTYSAHLQTNRLPGIQGRYLFVLLVPIAVLLVVGLVRIARRIRISDAWLLRGTALAGFGVTAVVPLLGFRIFYVVPGRSFGEGVDRFLAWVPWAPPVLLAMAAAYVVAGLLLCWVLVRRGAPPALDGGSPTDPGAPGGSVPPRPDAARGPERTDQVTRTP